MQKPYLFQAGVEKLSAPPFPAETQRLRALFLLARPHQYIKNLFIFAPLFFSGKFNEIVLNQLGEGLSLAVAGGPTV